MDQKWGQFIVNSKEKKNEDSNIDTKGISKEHPCYPTGASGQNERKIKDRQDRC